jgi:D-alanine-D-alanine ligase
MRVLVLMGGTSSERDVSLASGLRVAAALRQSGHVVTAIDTVHGVFTEEGEADLLSRGVMSTLPPDVQALATLDRTLPSVITGLPACDVIFLALHGGRGEDGTVQALLDLRGTPYTGSGHLASALAMDKDLAKHLMKRADVPTPAWLMAPVAATDVSRTIGFPCIVKPSKQGSTVGLSLVRESEDFAAAVLLAAQHDDEVMVEQFIAGRELTVAVLEGDALPVGEIIPKHELYDYECKYTPGMAREVFPADLTAVQAARVQQLAVRTFQALKLGGCARIDFRLGTDGEFYCLEANTLPGMTELSLVPQAAVAAGMSFPAFCDRIVTLAHQKGEDST